MNYAMYLRLFRRWFWLVGLAILVSGGAAFYSVSNQPDIYEATTKLQIGTFQQDPNPSTQAISLAQSLTNTYFVLARTRPFLETVMKQTDISMNPDDFALTFVMSVISETPFFTITASNTDPQKAADIANAIANEFVSQTEATTKNRNAQIASIQVQVDALSKQLASEQQELATIQEYLKQSNAADPILLVRENELITRIAQQQGNLAIFQNSLVSLQNTGITNVLTVLEPAIVPTKPLVISKTREVVIAGGIGGVLSIVVVSLLEQLNTTIRSSAEIPILLGLPVLSLIPSFGRARKYRKQLITWIAPNSKAAEAFRVLRGNLMYIDKDRFESGRQNYIITSSGIGEGKSIVAANLAIAFASIGSHVVLIDADLRRAVQHLIFELPNVEGLSDVLSYGIPEDDDKHLALEGGSHKSSDSMHPDANERELMTTHPPANPLSSTIPEILPIQKTKIPRLSVITSGSSKKNPADLVGSYRMKEVVDRLMSNEGFNIVIFDTPSVREVADSVMLAGVVRAPLVLVAEANRTNRNDALTLIERLSMLSLPMLGVVLNRAQDNSAREDTFRRSTGPGLTDFYNQ